MFTAIGPLSFRPRQIPCPAIDTVSKLAADRSRGVFAVRHLWFLKGCEPGCFVAISLAAEGRCYAPTEVPAIETLYYIHKGCVLFGGRVLASGSMWGEDIILSNPANYNSSVALCMSYVETIALARQVLVDIIQRFPFAAKRMNRAILLLALRRTLIRIRDEAAKLQLQLDTKKGRSASKQPSGFLDMVFAAAALRPVNVFTGDKTSSPASAPAEEHATGPSMEYRGPSYYEHYYDDIKATKAEVAALVADMSHTKLVVDSLRGDMAIIRRSMSQLLAANNLHADSGVERLAPILPLSSTERQARSRDFQKVNEMREKVSTARNALASMAYSAPAAAEGMQAPIWEAAPAGNVGVPAADGFPDDD